MSFKQFLISLLRPFVTLFALISLIIVPTTPVYARDLADLSLEITTDKKGAEAKQDAFDQATEQATQRLSEELLGPERMARSWPSLKAKLLRNATRYVLFIKGSAPQEAGPVTKITVNLRLSPDNLESLLREEGVLSSGGVKVLPLIEISDSHGARYIWWATAVSSLEPEKPSLVQDMFKKFFAQLMGKFKAKNIYVLDPTNSSFRLGVPAIYRSENLKREDQMLFAQYLKADVVLSGKVAIARGHDGGPELKLEYDLQLWQAKSGRAIGEVQRGEVLSGDAPKLILALLDQTDRKVVEDLSAKLADVLASGNLNLNVVKVSIVGAMSYRQQAELKRQLAQLREIRVLKERLFEPSRLVFEAESPVSGQELAKTIKKTRFPLYTIEVESAQDDGLALNVRALSSASAQ